MVRAVAVDVPGRDHGVCDTPTRLCRAALVSWMIERDSHKKNVSTKKAKLWRAKNRLTARDAELKRHSTVETNQPTAEPAGAIRMGSTYEDTVERRASIHKEAKKELKNLGGCGGVLQPLAVAPCTPEWVHPGLCLRADLSPR